MSSTLDLAKELIALKSITPEDAGCQEIVAERLKKQGFAIQNLDFGDVKNLWAIKGESGPIFAFLGHTDVVPPGPLDQWDSDPFIPTEKKDLLVGRGSADMKGSVAAFVTSIEEYLGEEPEIKGRIAVLLTSDEEGPAIDGVSKVIDHLKKEGETIKWCLVGEPTSNKLVGDVYKIGRRGSVSAKITILGNQGHVAYPDRAINPIHEFSKAMNELSNLRWKDKTGDFQDSVLQISNINSGTGVTNVIPGSLTLLLNVRHSPSTELKQIKNEIEAILAKHKLNFEILWEIGGQPFLTEKKELTNALELSIKEVMGINSISSTDGGTSDGRFVAPTGAQVVELGPGNASIHKINECVKIEDLDNLHKIYVSILRKLLSI